MSLKSGLVDLAWFGIPNWIAALVEVPLFSFLKSLHTTDNVQGDIFTEYIEYFYSILHM